MPTHGKAVGRGPLAPAPGLAPGTPENVVSTRINIPQTGGFTGPIDFLPVPYWPMRANVPGNWREEPGTLKIYSDSAPTDGLQYTVTSGQVEPTTAMLAAKPHIPPAISHDYLGFKSNLTRQLRTIALQVTRGKTTAFDKAVALEQWFLSSRFTYSIASTNLPNSPRGLLTFLTTDRQGFCQQFAFAMAVLARMIGIPSRVAIGLRQATSRQRNVGGDDRRCPRLARAVLHRGWMAAVRAHTRRCGGQQTAVEPGVRSRCRICGGQSNNNGGTSVAPSSPATKGAASGLQGRLRGHNPERRPPRRARSAAVHQSD